MAMTSIEEERPNNYSHSTHQHPLERAVSGRGITCSGCKMNIAAGRDYYTCCACSFSLHRACFNMPSSCQHQAEPGHDLILLLVPDFQCKACGLQGSGFCYNCNICDTEYHSLCLKRPATEKCSLHVHELQLMFFPPYQNSEGFKCDVCKGPGSNQWLYRCNRCDFDVHLNCIYAAPNPTSQPRNLSNLLSQTPLFSPTINNYNSSRSFTATPVSPGATYATHGPITQPSGHQFGQYQSQNPPVLCTSSVIIPASGNSMMGLSTGALPYGSMPSYAHPQSVPSYGNFGNQGGYAYGPVMSAQSGFMDMGVPSNVGYVVRNTNQPAAGHNNALGILGGGAGGVLFTGVLSGVGQGIGQGLVENAFDRYGSDDSSVVSDQNGLF